MPRRPSNRTLAGDLDAWKECSRWPSACFFAYRKARRIQVELFSRPARKFMLAFAPSLLAGAVLTSALWRAGPDRIAPRMLAAALRRRDLRCRRFFGAASSR